MSTAVDEEVKMKIPKSTIVAFFCGSFWGWLATVIIRAKIISSTESTFLWLIGCILIGVVCSFIEFK